jgi:hypothetical protein
LKKYVRDPQIFLKYHGEVVVDKNIAEEEREEQ